MWLPAGWGGVIGLGVSGCAGWALAYIGDAAIRDWATGLLAAVAGVSGLVIWIRSLDLDLADRQWRRRRVRDDDDGAAADDDMRSEEHTSELQSLMRISYAVFCLKKKKKKIHDIQNTTKTTLKIPTTLYTITRPHDD